MGTFGSGMKQRVATGIATLLLAALLLTLAFPRVDVPSTTAKSNAGGASSTFAVRAQLPGRPDGGPGPG